MTEPIGLLLQNFEETKKDYKDACDALKTRAIDLGMEPKIAEDIRLAISFLTGYRTNKTAPALEVMKSALNLIDNKNTDAAALVMDEYIRRCGGWK